MKKLVAAGTLGSETESEITGHKYGDHAYLDVYQYEGAAKYDAFGRLRVSTPYTIFDSKQLYDNQPLFWDDVDVSGSGTSSTFSATLAKSALAVSGLTAGARRRQTKRRFNYQTGKSQLILMTGNFIAGVSGVTKRIGLYDANNGFFFQHNGTFSVVKRINTSDSVITQANFNTDKLDGTGVSGVTYNAAYAQIFFIDFQWLGVGQVRMGIVYDGVPIVCHIFHHANRQAGVSVGNPNLPIQYYIENDGSGAATTLDAICSSVMSEAGSAQVGLSFSVDRGITGFATGASTSLFPLLSLRLKSTHIGAAIEIDKISIIAASTSSYRWQLVLNPTIAGVDAVSWVSVTNSAMQYDISRTTTNVISGGTVIDSGYVYSGNSANSSPINSLLKLGATGAGVQDQIVLCVQNLAAGAETYYASLTYNESI